MKPFPPLNCFLVFALLSNTPFLTESFSSSNGLSRTSQVSIFEDMNVALQGVKFGSVAWGDYDSDGDMDVLVTGLSGMTPIAIIYRNDNGTFTDINAGLTGVFLARLHGGIMIMTMTWISYCQVVQNLTILWVAGPSQLKYTGTIMVFFTTLTRDLSES